MKYSDKQYENVAIYLDGGDITLSDEESKLAEEISLDQQVVSAWINDPATLPHGKTVSASNGSIWKKVIFTTLAAAASVAIVAGVALHMLPQPKTDGPVNVANTGNGTLEIIESISEINLIKQQQQEAELATLLLEQSNIPEDPVAQDISSNADQWFQALSSSNQQGLAVPENSMGSA